MYISSHLAKLLVSANEIILTINRHDTLRALGIWLRPFANGVRDAKYHRRRSFFLWIGDLISATQNEIQLTHESALLCWLLNIKRGFQATMPNPFLMDFCIPYFIF